MHRRGDGAAAWGTTGRCLLPPTSTPALITTTFVVNPVNMWTGKKLEAKYEVYYKLRDMSDRICKEHGLSVVKNPQRHKTARSVYFAEKNDEPTRYNLMRRRWTSADDVEQLDGAECRAAEEGLCVRVRSLPQVRSHPLSKR